MIGVITKVVPVGAPKIGEHRSFELRAKDEMYSWKYHISPSARPQPPIFPVGSLVEITFNRVGYVTTIRLLRAGRESFS